MIIKRQPEEFQVHERLTDQWWSSIAELPGPGRKLAVYHLEKRSLTTPDAASKLAAALGIRQGDVSYAGLKDRHALTKQYMTTVATRGIAGSPKEIGGQGWVAARVGWAESHIDAKAIESNGFRIVVRGLTGPACVMGDDRVKRFGTPTGVAFPNVFGRQRFGSARHGQGFAGRALVDGDFETALKLLIGTPARKDEGNRRRLVRLFAERWGDWRGILNDAPRCPERRAIEMLADERGFREAFAALPYLTQQISVEAYQSHLWNRAAAMLLWIRSALAPAENEAVMVAGERLPVSVPLAELQRLAAFEAELPHRGMNRQGEWAGALSAVLDADGLDASRLSIPGLRRPAFGMATRPLCTLAKGLTLTHAPAGEAPGSPHRSGNAERIATLQFDLPRGAYATVLLEWLLGCANLQHADPG